MDRENKSTGLLETFHLPFQLLCTNQSSINMHYSLCGVTATSFQPQHFNFPEHSNTLDWQLLIKHLVCMWSFSSLRFMHIMTRSASVALVFAWQSKWAGFRKRRSDKQNVFVAGTVRIAYRKWAPHSLCLRKTQTWRDLEDQILKCRVPFLRHQIL